MKIFSNSLIVLFVMKCLYEFVISKGTIVDGICLLIAVIYLFVVVDLKLPQDERKRVK